MPDTRKEFGGRIDDQHIYRVPRHEPPMHGIIFRKQWIDNRINDIFEAIEDYRRHKYIIPVEWIEELLGLMREQVDSAKQNEST